MRVVSERTLLRPIRFEAPHCQYAQTDGFGIFRRRFEALGQQRMIRLTPMATNNSISALVQARRFFAIE